MLIVIIEDNESLAKGVALQLRDKGHAVDILSDAKEGASHIRSNGADLVILDLNLGRGSGLQILRDMRARGDSTAVLILTARGDTADRVEGLDAGADDYLVKPFEMLELEARIRALSRRRPADQTLPVLIGNLLFDRGSRQLSVDGRALDLPRRELALFECLLNKRGRLVSKSILADHLYGTGTDIDETVVETYVSRLRKRLSPHRVRITTARGIGYRLDEESNK